jgi:hypothetical protein
MVWASGCTDLCLTPSKCSADPAPTALETQQCRDASKKGVKCSQEYNDASRCLQDHQVCGADKKTDSAATAASCADKLNALSICNG